MAANSEIGGWPSAAPLDPLDPEFRVDPYPRYEQLRGEDPVHWIPLGSRSAGGFWLVTRYADCLALLEDLRLGMTGSDGRPPAELARGALARLGPPGLLFDDRPRYRRLREGVARAVGALDPWLRAIAGELLSPLEKRGGMDLIADFAVPFSQLGVCELLAVPESERAKFQEWLADFARIFEPALQAPSDLSRCNRAAQSLLDRLEDRIRVQQKGLRGGVLAELAGSDGQEGERPSPEELLALGVQLLLYGSEIAVGLIGNGTLALLQHPDQLARLRSDQDLVGGAVEECLRFDSPVQLSGRIAQEEIELRGVRIERDQRVALAPASANRDSDAFDYPTHFDITRSGPAHLSFGSRSQGCPGAPLARVLAQIALGTLVRRLPRLALVTEKLEHRRSLLFRRLERLPLHF